MTPLMPTWLPPLAPVSGDLGVVVRALFSIFELDFVTAKPYLENMPIWWDRNPIQFEGIQCCLGFRHIIARDDNRCIRQFDPPRAERMPWCKPILTHGSDTDLKVWRHLEQHERIKIYVWLESQDYVAVLEERRQHIGTVAFLITAYHVDGESVRHSLQQKWEERLP